MQLVQSVRFTPVLIFVLACCIALLVSACSLATVGYAYAPSLATWRASSYFGLSSELRASFKESMERVHAWHRREELPRILDTLRELQAMSGRTLTEADGLRVVRDVQDHYRLVVGRVIDETSSLLPLLQQAQIDTLERQLGENDAEFDETWIDAEPAKVRAARFERFLDQAEDWLGRLEPEQRRWLQGELDGIPVDYAAWRADRQRRQTEFVELIKQGGSNFQPVSAVPVAKLRRWALDWDSGRSLEQRARIDRALREYVRLWVEHINGATPVQRAHLADKLGY
jgi:hypothetical protein